MFRAAEIFHRLRNHQGNEIDRNVRVLHYDNDRVREEYNRGYMDDFDGPEGVAALCNQLIVSHLQDPVYFQIFLSGCRPWAPDHDNLGVEISQHTTGGDIQRYLRALNDSIPARWATLWHDARPLADFRTLSGAGVSAGSFISIKIDQINGGGVDKRKTTSSSSCVVDNGPRLPKTPKRAKDKRAPVIVKESPPCECLPGNPDENFSDDEEGAMEFIAMQKRSAERRERLNPTPMRLKVSAALAGRTTELTVPIGATAMTVKQLLFDLWDVPVSRQRLFLDGKQLDDTRTLRRCGVRADCTLNFAVRLQGGGPAVAGSRSACGSSSMTPAKKTRPPSVAMTPSPHRGEGASATPKDVPAPTGLSPKKSRRGKRLARRDARLALGSQV
jgi:hypothetical protein